MRKIRIGSRWVGEHHPCFIIAEAGINHNGDIDIAKQLIKQAFECGWNAVKFQKRTIDIVYSEEFLNSPRISPWGKTQRVQKEHLEFGRKEYNEIDEYCRELGIDWFASAWDIDSQIFLDKYNTKFNKVASPMLTNLDYLEFVAKKGKKTLISTGMSTIDDIDKAVNIFREYECPFVLMHCVSIYPCPSSRLNLNMINTLRKRYNCEIGYSGHSPSILDSVIATTLGAKYIEKHITLDRAMYGSDQAASLERRGMELTYKYCNSIPIMLGSGKKVVYRKEIDNARKLRYW